MFVCITHKCVNVMYAYVYVCIYAYIDINADVNVLYTWKNATSQQIVNISKNYQRISLE